MSPVSARPGKRATDEAATTKNRAQRPLRGSLRRAASARSTSRRLHRAIGLVGLAFVAAAVAAVTDMRPSMAQTRDTGTETIFADDGWPLPPDPAEPLSLLPSSRVRWDCNMFPDLETFTKDVGSLTLNNFRLRAKSGRFSNTPSAEVSFTVINRSKERAFTTFQFTVYDRTSPLPSIAFSLEPSFGIIAADSTKQLTARVNVRPGEVERAARFCIRADG